MTKWDEEFDATIQYANSGNDYYYEWVDLESENCNSIASLFEDELGLGFSKMKVRVKIQKGKAIFITKV